MNYRKLTTEEITQLEANGCRCNDWNRVEAASPFRCNHYRDVSFSGDIRLGTTENQVLRNGKIPMDTGIYNAVIHNCTIGNDVFINRVGNYIADYDIADNVMIENVGSISMSGESAFGNGVEVSVLNETGGREVPIYDCLSAHIAYIIAMYRHDKLLISRLRELISGYVASKRSSTGTIARNVTIINTGTVTDVSIGEYATIEGATRLTNGSIVSEQADPVFVGPNVMAEDFIMSAGAHVSEGAVLVHTFVGQATSLTRLFSAHDSLFFANCACENGESAAIFAGPYTVTMHKSSLLIAGMFSFLNAGSGSNQSNHMYKLGPIHQGVVERGSKTTSDSYILWPAKIGAFSLVMGRHVNHPDTSRLPFSYLIENRGESFLVPGINIRSVGTIRDAQKWPRRDKRKTPARLDNINFNLLSPYTAGKMLDGIDLLNQLERTAGLTAERFAFQTMTIDAHALRKGRKLYGMALDKFMGNTVISRLGLDPIADEAELTRRLTPTAKAGAGQWVDVCGLFAPKSEVDAICDEITDGTLDSVDAIEARWKELHAQYYDMEWTWVADIMESWYGKPVEALTRDDIRTIIERWLKSVTALNDMLLDDARKEYSLKSRTGFGIDDPAMSADDDFTSVRGSYEADPFVAMVNEHTAKKTALAGRALAQLG